MGPWATRESADAARPAFRLLVLPFPQLARTGVGGAADHVGGVFPPRFPPPRESSLGWPCPSGGHSTASNQGRP